MAARVPPTPNKIIEGDCIEVMRKWPDDCIDHCIADPPFGIASGGGRGGNRKGLGWAFSSHVTMQETWDHFSEDDFFRFNVDWLREVCRVVKPNGNILVFGTFHNIYQLGFILQSVLERRILNSIIWFKPNAQPNITARSLTESTEQLIWAVNETPKRAKNWVFNYSIAKELADDRQMRNFWAVNGADDLINVSAVPVVAKGARTHPSQKPAELVNRLVRLGTRPNEVVLDPFAGSGVVAPSALRYRRKYVLLELLPEYVAAAHREVQEFWQSKRGRFLRRDTSSAMPFADEELDLLMEIPVPQADHLDLVFTVPSYVQMQGGEATRRKVALELLDYVDRQGPYYADAAMALRLVQPSKVTGSSRQTFEVAPLGMRWLRAPAAQKPELQRHIVLTAPVVRYLAYRLRADVNDPLDDSGLLDESLVAAALQELDLAPNTAHRRAKTLCGWLRKVNQDTRRT